jgi:hypothetical protein
MRYAASRGLELSQRVVCFCAHCVQRAPHEVAVPHPSLLTTPRKCLAVLSVPTHVLDRKIDVAASASASHVP